MNENISKLKLHLSRLERTIEILRTESKYYGEKPEERHPEGSGEHGGRFAPREGGTPSSDKPTGKHPGAGYSTSATLDRNGVIHTDSVYDAQLALHENRKVSLDQVEKVSTVLDKLHKTALDMQAKGEKAPSVDLCNMTVKGTNLFCAETKGVPRVHMPQFAKDGQKGDIEGFESYLADRGIKNFPGKVPASHLKATQSQLDGVKVAGMMQGMKKDPSAKWVTNALIVSREGYVVDGHHRWAAKVGLDSKGGENLMMKVLRVDAPIIELLGHALTYTKGKGRAAFGKSAMSDLVRKLDKFLEANLPPLKKKF